MKKFHKIFFSLLLISLLVILFYLALTEMTMDYVLILMFGGVAIGGALGVLWQ